MKSNEQEKAPAGAMKKSTKRSAEYVMSMD
jgi:hypothetical protein